MENGIVMGNLISNDSDCSYCIRYDILIWEDEVSAGTENADTDIPNSFFLVPFKKVHQKQFAFSCEVQQYTFTVLSKQFH